MGLDRGFKAIKGVQKRAEERKKVMQALQVRDIWLKDSGQKTKLWFTGDPKSEPVIKKFHSINHRGRFSFEVCAEGHHGHAGCVFCFRRRSKDDKRVGAAQEMACLGAAEDRWVHKVKNEEKTAKAGGKYDRYDWHDCTRGLEKDLSLCRFCKKGLERERVGQRRLRLNLTQTLALDALQEELSSFCLNCVKKGGEPTIRTVGYKSTVSGKVLPDIDDVDDPENWEPQFKCSGCKSPRPGSIFHCPIIYKRTGVGKATQYSFSAGDPPRFQDPPEWVQKMEPFDVAAALIPRSAENMAEFLDCENPFDKGSSGGGDDGPEDDESYEDDEEEEESSDEEDEE